ncbi:MAG: serine hydrolase domain-containing protein [Thermomicrobiales bacterium]
MPSTVAQEPTLSRRAALKSALVASAAAALPALARPAAAFAQATPVSATPGADAALDAIIPELEAFVTGRMAELGVPGVAVGIVAGNAEYAAGFGVTNIDHPLPVDAKTLFQIGSTTKTFTGTALMRLVEQGKVELDAPVRTYLPDFRVADAETSEEVLVKHLVTHTAGWYGDDFTDPGDGDDALAQYVAEMADLPQIAPVGEFFSYNNAAVSTAGRVIEVVTGKPYEEAVRELVLEPLGLEHSYFFADEVMTQAFAVGHTASPDDPDGPPQVVPVWALPRSVAPAGGIISSVEDQVRYARFHLGDGTVEGETVLSPESLAAMQTAHGPGGSLGVYLLDGVGVTWLLTSIDGERAAMHGGSTNGQQSSFLMLPDRDFAITVLTNADMGAVVAEETVLWVLDHLYGLSLPEPAPFKAPAADLAAYAGAYTFGDGLLLTVAEADGALSLSVTQNGEPIPDGAGALTMVAPDRAVFDMAGVPFLTDFVRDDAGEVAWVRFSGRMAPRKA